jgi:hypothetical protein
MTRENYYRPFLVSTFTVINLIFWCHVAADQISVATAYHEIHLKA